MADTVSSGYSRRLIDDELDELLDGLPAISVEGPRAVGKTATALQRARTVYQQVSIRRFLGHRLGQHCNAVLRKSRAAGGQNEHLESVPAK
jgi:hypothetical protein